MSHLEVAVAGGGGGAVVVVAITSSSSPAGGWDTAAGCVCGVGNDREGSGIVSLGVSMVTD